MGVAGAHARFDKPVCGPKEGSGDMVIGLTRARPRYEPRSVFSLVPLHRSIVSDDWQSNRGAVRFEASCDLFGGFPGFAQVGGVHAGAQLRLTDHFLLIDDGKTSGFGLPISWLEGAVVLPLPGRDEPGLRIFFRDGPCPRVFTIRFRGGRLSMRAHRRAEHAFNVLTSLGMSDKYELDPLLEPSFRVPWDQTREYEMENVVWTGATTAPLYIGLDSAPADVWLTTKSLIWGGPGGEGINRMPLPLLQDVITAQVDDRHQTPAVYISFGDETTGRFDLGFLFDRYDAERNLRERGAFLVGLRSRGIPLGSPVPRYQPWRITAYPGPSQPALPRDTDELPTMERPLQKGRRSGFVHAISRNGSRPDVPEWDADYAEHEGLEFIDVADPVWPESHATVPFLRIVDDAHAGPFSEKTQFWDVEGYEHDRWERESAAATSTTVDEEEQSLTEYSFESLVETEIENATLPPDEPIVLEPDDEPRPAPASDVVLAEYADPIENERMTVEPAFIGDYQLAANWTFDSTSRDDLSPVPSSAFDDQPMEDGMAAIKQYEASSLAVLGEVLNAISDRVEGLPSSPLTEPLPTPTLQATALASLIELTASGTFDMDEARWRKSRLVGLGESGARLRSLLELHDAGHIDDEVLIQKKAAITAELSTLIHPKR
jgi:hypothetical protein